MEGSNSSRNSPIKKMIPILLVVAGLFGLYYLYEYLYGPKTNNAFTLVEKNRNANIDSPIIINSDKLPNLFEGGEFTISTWIYISSWSYKTGRAKSIINIGGTTFDTIRIYLGGFKPKLHVRLHTKDGLGDTSETLYNQDNSRKSTFESQQMDNSLTDSNICDLPEVELQRWVNISVSVNGRTVDVYLDGKLARSCVLPKVYKVDAGPYSAKLLEYGGFGGQLSTTIMYDAALNPDIVYKNYMAGPEPITNVWDWFSSIFSPGVSISVNSK